LPQKIFVNLLLPDSKKGDEKISQPLWTSDFKVNIDFEEHKNEKDLQQIQK
jgi:hypothetical protein